MSFSLPRVRTVHCPNLSQDAASQEWILVAVLRALFKADPFSANLQGILACELHPGSIKCHHKGDDDISTSTYFYIFLQDHPCMD